MPKYLFLESLIHFSCSLSRSIYLILVLGGTSCVPLIYFDVDLLGIISIGTLNVAIDYLSNNITNITKLRHL